MQVAHAKPARDPFAEVERLRIRANTRAMSVSGVLVSVLVSVYVFAFDRDYVAVPVLTACGMAVGFVLVRGRHVRLGTVLSVAVIQACLMLLTIRHGPDAGIQMGFAIVGMVALAVFETVAQRWSAFAVILVTGALAASGRLDFALPEAGVDTPYEVPFYTLAVLLAIYWLSDDLLKINRDFRRESRRAVDEIGARSAELTADLRRLGRRSGELRDVHDALAEEVALGERTQRALRVSREQLEQFVYAASHDLKEPLRSISGFVQLIRRRLAHADDPEINEYCEIVSASSGTMTRLLDGLLAYSRVGEAAAECKAFDLTRVALAVRHELSAYAQSRGGEIEVADGLGSIYATRDAVAEILRQVVHNGLKFSAAGEAPRVTIAPLPDGTGLAVRDYGIGIAAEFRERIFLLFERLNRVDDYEGAGIGLAHARKLARLYDIELAAAPPAEGPGTVIRITSPPPPPHRASAPPQ